MRDKIVDLLLTFIFNPFFILGMPALCWLLFGTVGLVLGIGFVAILIMWYNKEDL